MTRRDYARLSSALNNGRRLLEMHGAEDSLLIGFDNAAHTIASELAVGNPAFDETRFKRDAGSAP